MVGVPTGTVTFLFTDIEGSTKLAREHPGKEKVCGAALFSFASGDAICVDVSLRPSHSDCHVKLVSYEMPQLLVRKSI